MSGPRHGQPEPAADAPRWVEPFDSSSGMFRALARVLHGLDLPTPDRSRAWAPLLLPLANRLPLASRQQLYSWAGWSSANPLQALDEVDVEALGRWVAEAYPERQYPAVAIGSPNGAAVHLCAALGIPWLPQTFLIPVRRLGIDRDDLRGELAWGLEHVPRLLQAAPELAVHHMIDPNQDRLMSQHMAYLRVKLQQLPEAWRRFLRERLAPGGTLLSLECEHPWPVVRLGPRHVFQVGGEGGLTAEEYLHPDPRIVEFLEAWGSPVTAWDAPEPTERAPEAEWGFDPALRGDLVQLSRALDVPMQRLVFRGAQGLSRFVADLHRDWFGRLGRAERGLLVESFMLMEPLQALCRGLVPFWTAFPTEPSALDLQDYLETSEPFEQIAGTLFSHGLHSLGHAPVERWRSLLERGRRPGQLLGVDEAAHPADFAVLVRFHDALLQAFPDTDDRPDPLAYGDFAAFARRHGPARGVHLHTVGDHETLEEAS